MNTTSIAVSIYFIGLLVFAFFYFPKGIVSAKIKVNEESKRIAKVSQLIFANQNVFIVLFC